MKRMLHRISAPLLALLVLASTISWTVDKHLCMGRVQDISLFAHARDCGMEGANGERLQKPCCDDESFTLQGQDDLKRSWDDLDLDHQSFLVTFPRPQIQHLVSLEWISLPNEDYPPPLLIRDIHVLDRVFLI